MAQGTVYVVSNFTADPLSTGLTFWFDSLQLPWTVEFAPYDQIFQQLLDPGSGLRQNRGGANVLLVRLDRLARADASRQSGTILDELITALRDAVTATAQPMLVVCCPATQPGERDAATANAHMEEQLASAFAGSGQVTVLRSRDVLAPLGNAPWHDPETEALGDIPYTELFFVSLATAIARHVRLLIAPPHKVIALDCDNTLWRGVVGELGSDGVEIDNAARRLQEFLVTQQEAGMLLVLCSKNNFADVEEVFRTRSDTPLKWEHIVRSRINWEPKSVNLRALASELNLGLDSFVFIDDSAYEIAEVRQNAPEVLALHLPSADKDVERFLRASWWSDRLTVTDADRRRGATYREQLERSDAIQQSGSLEDFLRGLQLVVDVLPPRAAALARAAQMTLRTNQFNLSTIRRTEQELAALLASGALEARIINVRDRFGDYGTVGLLLFSVEGKRLVADTFLLSCRALSRRVEHRMLAMLGQVARERGAERIELPYVKSKKNAPILAFLNLLGVEENAIEADHRFVVSVEQALAAPELPFDASIAADGDDAGDAAPVAATGSSMNDALAKICSEWATPADLLPAIRAYVRRMAPAAPARTLVPPRTDTERDLVAAFQRALHTEDVGITDNFFDLGGDSVGAVALFAQLRRRYDRSLVPTLLLEAGSVEQLAARLSTRTEQRQELTSLVPIQPEGKRPPLFCLHAGMGTVLFYYPLAKALGKDQPLYAFQAQGLYGKETAHASIPEMAAHYIREMRTVQPAGPYRLAGFCLGATIAFEMAMQLTDAGEEVALLASFDGLAPWFKPKGQAWSATPAHWTGRVLRRALGALINKRNQMLRAYQRRRGGPVPRVFRLLKTYIAFNNHMAKTSYVPTTMFPGDILVYTVKGRYPQPSLGWERYTQREVRLREIAGDLRAHRDLMHEPMVEMLARDLEYALAAPDQALADELEQAPETPSLHIVQR